jgi:hypothetical protein
MSREINSNKQMSTAKHEDIDIYREREMRAERKMSRKRNEQKWREINEKREREITTHSEK